jgi:diaminopimelate epimerase
VIPFTKMHGIGNDFVLVDCLTFDLGGRDLAELARRMCHRRFGAGADGLILAERGQAASFRMRMFNPDGSESEMCGNGIRCLAKLLRAHGHSSDACMDIETGAGVLMVEVLRDGRVRVDMGRARLLRGEVGVAGDAASTFIEEPVEALGKTFTGTAVSMGNPHLVVFVENVGSVPLESWGPALESHVLFPQRINVHFVEAKSRARLVPRPWERGAGATLACGTGACAAAVAGIETGRCDSPVRVALPGGELEIDVAPDRRTHMTGPAETVYSGEWLE